MQFLYFIHFVGRSVHITTAKDYETSEYSSNFKYLEVDHTINLKMMIIYLELGGRKFLYQKEGRGEE